VVDTTPPEVVLEPEECTSEDEVASDTGTDTDTESSDDAEVVDTTPPEVVLEPEECTSEDEVASDTGTDADTESSDDTIRYTPPEVVLVKQTLPPAGAQAKITDLFRKVSTKEARKAAKREMRHCKVQAKLKRAKDLAKAQAAEKKKKRPGRPRRTDLHIVADQAIPQAEKPVKPAKRINWFKRPTELAMILRAVQSNRGFRPAVTFLQAKHGAIFEDLTESTIRYWYAKDTLDLTDKAKDAIMRLSGAYRPKTSGIWHQSASKAKA